MACFRTREAWRKSDRGAAEPLSCYETKVEAGIGRLRVVGGAKLFETSYRRNTPQQRLFALADLGEAGWPLGQLPP